MKSEGTWIFCAGGKHPVAKDFIVLGQETRIMKALFRWMEEGWSRVKDVRDHHSWRFFTRGLKSGELACGLVRDSRDSAGRPFPFMVAGCGAIEKWELKWELLPLAFDDVWERLELLCIERFFDLDALKGEIGRLPRPVIDRPRPVPQKEVEVDGPCSGVVSVALSAGEDFREEAVSALRLIRERAACVPAAVFIGGTEGKAGLKAFMRSLTAADFEMLWATRREPPRA